MKEKDVIRIYKSFFVYGIGFNNFLREVTRGNKEAMKNLWTIYAMMLEYCADGTYESLVGEMERDKMRKIS